MFSHFNGVTGDNRKLGVTLILPLIIDMPIYVSPELFANMYCWSSSQGSGCERSLQLISHTWLGLYMARHRGPFVSLMPTVGDPLIREPIIMA